MNQEPFDACLDPGRVADQPSHQFSGADIRRIRPPRRVERRGPQIPHQPDRKPGELEPLKKVSQTKPNGDCHEHTAEQRDGCPIQPDLTSGVVDPGLDDRHERPRQREPQRHHRQSGGDTTKERPTMAPTEPDYTRKNPHAHSLST